MYFRRLCKNNIFFYCLPFFELGIHFRWLIMRLTFQDLKKKPKYLVTFTVGWDQRDNINAAVKKVIVTTYKMSTFYFYSSLWLNVKLRILRCSHDSFSFLMISKSCFFTMMVEQHNGIDTSGQNRQFMLV